MTIAVLGATGFVGHNLVKALLANTTYRVRAIAPDMEHFDISDPRLETISGDVFSRKSMDRSLNGVQIAYYLVHMLDSTDTHFDTKEASAAETFGAAAHDAGVSRVIYMSGLGRDKEKLSRHLTSRHRTGDILRTYVPTVIEFRASMIVGPGSISFEIIKDLVKKLSVILLPNWSKTLTQPIGSDDAMKYLIAGMTVPVAKHEIIEIGGQEKMNYQRFFKAYADYLGKQCLLIRIPMLPEWVVGWWLYCFMPRATARVGKNMIGSLQNEMIVTNDKARVLFPDIVPEPVERFFV